MPGNAPALLKGNAHFVKSLPSLMGYGSIAAMLGNGDAELGSKAHLRGEGTKSANFGDKEMYGHIDGELLDAGLTLKKTIHAAILKEQIDAGVQKRNPRPLQETEFFKVFCEPLVKAYDLTDFSNWAPTSNFRFYLDEFHVPPGLAEMFPQQPMQTRVQEVPTATGELLGRLEADNATFGAQYESQSKITLTTKDNVVHTDITEDLIEDAVPSAFDRLREKVLIGLQKSRDRAILDGDTTNPHMDNDVTAGSTDFRTAWMGLRKKALANTTNGSVSNAGDPLNKAILDAMITLMGEFFDDTNDLIWILSAKQKNKIITGALPELLTLWAFGNQATLLTGKCPPIYGVPVHVARHMRNDLHTSGVNTVGGPNVSTGVLLVKKSRFMVGTKAGARVWISPSLPTSDKMLCTGKERVSFGGVTQSATEQSVIYGYNVLS